MVKRKWRNPYPSKQNKAKKNKLRKLSTVKKPGTGISSPPKSSMDLEGFKIMSYKLRDEVKTISSRINELESTMDSVCQICEMLDHFSGKTVSDNGLTTSPRLMRMLKNVDIKQLLGLLQSPLIQALVEGEFEEDTKKKATS